MTAVHSLAPHTASSAVQDGVRDLLLEVDSEFVPPLSTRADTLALHSPSGCAMKGRGRYLDALRRESWLAALAGDEVVGLLTFLDAHDDPRLAAWSPSLYATTVAVAARVRRKGVARQLYDALEATARQRAVPYLTTRTWTTNSGHLGFLHSRGFQRVAQLPNDRSTGVGTVYLAYQVRGDPSWVPDLTTRR